MTQPEPIFNDYLKIFDDAAYLELLRAPERDHDKITAYVRKIEETLKIHTYFVHANLANVASEIFHEEAIRDYVLCLRDRFMIAIAGNEHISYTKLCQLISTFGTDGGTTDYAITSAFVPKTIAEGMSPLVKTILEILKENSFLMVPLMICLNFSAELNAQPDTKPKK